MLRCMRTTLSLDDDVAALLEQTLQSRNASLKQVVNDALREGLAILSAPRPTSTFRTIPVDLGDCFFPNLDNAWEVLSQAEEKL